MDGPILCNDESVTAFDDMVKNDPNGEEVAHLEALIRREVSIAHKSTIRPQISNSTTQQHVSQIDHAYPLGPLLTAAEAQMGGGPMVVAIPVPPPAAQQPPAVQQPNQQQQQPAVQQPGRGDRSCPVQGCSSLAGNTRLDHLWDHLAEVHGYERAANEHTTSETHLKRKTAPALKGLFTRDVRKLAWIKACLQALETAIKQRDNTYRSCHGLTLAMPHTIPDANASRKHQVITMLQNVRGEMAQKGRLYNQSGGAKSSWEEVYENLVSTFQLDQDDQDAVIRQAEQHLAHLRSSMGDDMSHQVSPTDVVRTHTLVLKQGASLPPK